MKSFSKPEKVQSEEILEVWWGCNLFWRTSAEVWWDIREDSPTSLVIFTFADIAAPQQVNNQVNSKLRHFPNTNLFGSERTEILGSPQSYWPPNSEMEKGKFFNYNVAKFLQLVLILGVFMLLLGILCLVQAIYANSRRFYGIFCVLFSEAEIPLIFTLFYAWSNSHPSLPHQTSSGPSNCQKNSKKVTLCMFSDYKI